MDNVEAEVHPLHAVDAATRVPPPTFLKKEKLMFLVNTGRGGRIYSVSLPPLRGYFPSQRWRFGKSGPGTVDPMLSGPRWQ